MYLVILFLAHNLFIIAGTDSIGHPSPGHTCNHVHTRPSEVYHINLEDRHVIVKRSADQPLRIKVFYDDSVTNLPFQKLQIINNTILPKALSYWQRALRVKPLSVPIRLSRKCPNNIAYTPSTDRSHQYCISKCDPVTTCGEIIVPEEHLDSCRVCDPHGAYCRTITPRGLGIPRADFIFYVSAMQTDRCNKGATVAYAAHCQQESGLDRPIAGHANLCPESISTKPQDMDTLLSTVKHEILHALGFSVSLYAYFRDKEGNPLTPRDSNGKPTINKQLNAPEWSSQVVRKITRPEWKVRGGVVNKDVYTIVTPRVVEEVRRHFNCSSLEGAELEDQGEDGTLLTHWEKRLFENEAMTGTHTQNPVYSRITLALMEDTGWYQPNYELAQDLKWGENLGCDFAMKSCTDWMEDKRARKESIHPFCDKVKRDPLETECTDGRNAVALCNLMEYKRDLPSNYQNFIHIRGVKTEDIGRYGGSVNLADFCPYIQEFTWKSNDIVVRGSQCSFDENNPSSEKNFALEEYGPKSKCFNHNQDMWEERTCTQVRQWQHWGSGCYQYKCKNGRLHLIISNNTYTCFHEDQHLKIQRYVNEWLHIGTVVCPACSDVCEMRCKPDIYKNHRVTANTYHKDFLRCGSEITSSNVTVILLCLFLIQLMKRS